MSREKKEDIEREDSEKGPHGEKGKKRLANNQQLTTNNLSGSRFPTPDSQLIGVGKIVSPQGLKGEVRVYPDSDFPERFVQPGTRWLLRPGQKEPQPIELLSGRYLDGKGLYLVRFAGVTDRNQAEELRGAILLAQASDRPPLEENEFHVLDLIGLEVFDQATQTLIGKVIQVIPAGNDLLEVERSEASSEKPKTVLIPFVEAIVPVVDLEQKRIEITPPAGLIE